MTEHELGLARPRDAARITALAPSGPLISHTIDRDELTIGREAGNDLVLQDTMVSRRHLRIRRDGAGWAAEDLGSRHGTRLDGRPLLGAAPIAHGARLAIGRSELRFEIVAADGGATRSAVVSTGDDGPVLVGESPAMRNVRALLTRFAASSSPVLLLGESGTGKEIAARLLHLGSPRADKPFVVVNCPALPGNLLEAELFGIEKNVATGVSARPGKLEEADGGTLFLDELGDMELAAQAKLLRFVQEKQVERVGGRKPFSVDARVVAATHHDLAADVAAGRFRLDLYYRLNTLVVNLPPLRERGEDVPLLVEHFLSRLVGASRVVSPAALELLRRHDFPGNVRELEALVTRAALFADGPVIGAEAFALAPAAPGVEDGARALLRRIEAGESFWDVVQAPFLRRSLPLEVARDLIALAFADAGGSYRRMAARLGVVDFREYKKLTDFIRNHALHSRRGVPDP
jgi:DNA-binding NtrC family response regulator